MTVDTIFISIAFAEYVKAILYDTRKEVEVEKSYPAHMLMVRRDRQMHYESCVYAFIDVLRPRRGFRPETPLLNLQGSNVSRDGRVGTRSPEITLYTRV